MTQNVLIVDDSPLMRQMLKASLARYRDLVFWEAGSGAEALKLVSQRSYVLVMTDINMPGLDGIKLISHIRKDPGNDQMAIVVISSEDEVEHVEKVVKLGIQAYLIKPVSGDEILETVQKIIQPVPDK